MPDVVVNPTAVELQRELQRKMLILLASIFLVVGIVYVAWVLARFQLSRFPYASASLAVTSAVVLVLVNRTRRHDLLLGLMNLTVFVVFSYTSLHQVGIRSSSLWWLVIPIICTAFTRQFVLSLMLGIAFAVLLAFMYWHGPTSIAETSLTSTTTPDEQLLLAIVMSTMAVLLFIGVSVQWIKRCEDELIKAKLLTDEALAAKSLFMAKMSHEIRTPLNGMIGATELLQASSTPDSQKPQLMAVQEHSAKMLLALVNDILDFSKLEAQKVTPELSPVRIRRIVFQTSELFSVQAFDKGIELTCSRTPAVPRTVLTDETRVRQIVSNLVSNAIKFTAKGCVHVHMDYHAKDGAVGLLSVEVTDTGIGIRAERLPTLFDAYEQTDNSVARVYGGTGLGLNICQNLAKLMGGRVDVVSTVGEGSTFTLTLPAEKATSPDEANERPTHRVDGNYRALVATDCIGMRRHMQTLLDDLGVGVTLTSEMPNLNSVSQARADLVFVDAPMLRAATDAKVKLDGLASEGVRVALLAPLGSDVMIGAAVGTTLLYKPVRRSHARDFILGAAIVAHVLPQQVDIFASVPPTGHAPPMPAEKWMNVLIADDNPVNQVVTQAMLANMNCSAVIVHNGIEVLEAIGRHRFDAVLLDLQMPEMDGLTTVRELRRREQVIGRGRLPVIAMTGNNETSDVAACLEAGMDRFLSKPFGLAQLRHALESLTSSPA